MYLKNKTIIFDLDGTLVDCKDLHRIALKRAINKYAPDFWYDEELIEARPTVEKIKLLVNQGLNADVESIMDMKFFETMNEMNKFIKPNDILLNEFNRLSKNYNLCIASNARSEFVFKTIAILGITNLTCVFTPQYGPPKPNVWMFQQCMKVTNVDKINTFIFEDSFLGIECAKSIGATVFEVKNSEDTISKMKEL
jgi:HAD superfamily hydrolase (TIGR01509 family)